MACLVGVEDVDGLRDERLALVVGEGVERVLEEGRDPNDEVPVPAIHANLERLVDERHALLDAAEPGAGLDGVSQMGDGPREAVKAELREVEGVLKVMAREEDVREVVQADAVNRDVVEVEDEIGDGAPQSAGVCPLDEGEGLRGRHDREPSVPAAVFFLGLAVLLGGVLVVNVGLVVGHLVFFEHVVPFFAGGRNVVVRLRCGLRLWRGSCGRAACGARRAC